MVFLLKSSSNNFQKSFSIEHPRTAVSGHVKAFVFIKITRNKKNNCPLITETLQSYSKMLLKMSSFTRTFSHVSFEITQTLLMQNIFLWLLRYYSKTNCKIYYILILKGGLSGRMIWQFLNALELFSP